MQNKRNGWLAAALLWTVVIFSFSLQPADASTDLSLGFLKGILDLFSECAWEALNSVYLKHLELIHTLVRKGAHFTEYLILGMLALQSAVRRKTRHPAAAALAYAAVVASADEILQRFVEGRHGCLTDVCIDVAGAAVGILVILMIRRRTGKKKR